MQSDKKHILIISTSMDTATDAVVRVLNFKGIRFTRLNTEEFPFNSSLTMLTYNKSINDNSIIYKDFIQNNKKLDQISSIWYRKFKQPKKPECMDEGTFGFCLKESKSLLLGVISSYTNKIMSHPEKIYLAELKPYQLRIAQEVGFQIPDTLISNEPDEIKKYYHIFDKNMIVKTVKNGYAEVENNAYSIYTSKILEEHLEHIARARWCPSIYQRHIHKKSDLRVTYVDGKIFAAEIDSQSDPSAIVDWRQTLNPNLPHRIHPLPEELKNKIKTFMTKLGLVFGALDFILTPNNEYVFLEVNPNGQWLWMDNILGLGITENIANWLIN